MPMLSLALEVEKRTWHLSGNNWHYYIYQIQQIHASHLRNDERQKDLYAKKRNVHHSHSKIESVIGLSGGSVALGLQ